MSQDRIERMRPRHRLWFLLACVGLVAPTAALAQSGQSRRPGPQPSHIRLEPGPNVADMTDQDLSRRLDLAREAHELEKVPDLLQRLTQDPEFLKALKNLSPAQKKQLAKLGQDLMLGKSPEENPAWNDLLKGLRSNQGDLQRVLKDRLKSDAELLNPDLLQRWAQKKQPEMGKVTEGTSSGHSPGPDHAPLGSVATSPAGAPGQPGPAQPHEPSLWGRLEDKSNSWFKEHVNDWAKDMGEWADSPLGNSLRNALRRAGEHRPGSGEMPFNLAERTRGLTGPLGKIREYLPTERLRSLDLVGRLRNAHLPSLPSGGMTAPSLASVRRASGSGVVSALLWALVLLTLAGVLWKSLCWYREQAANGDGWRLGPWPVRPESVATRAELVSAFEYLAVLCLGQVALACNHLDLAARLGAREGTDFEKQRAAENLAGLYEQARYAPPDEALRPEELAAARRDLCLLAGVGSA